MAYKVIVWGTGLIGFEHEIVAEILKRLPAASRVHTLGVGSSVNRSLLGPAARAGRGTESIVGLDEEWEEVTNREAELGYHFSIQCSDICYLANEVENGAQFRLFKKRAS